MRPLRHTLPTLAVVLALGLAAAPAGAGIGDMLKNKAKEAVTGK